MILFGFFKYVGEDRIKICTIFEIVLHSALIKTSNVLCIIPYITYSSMMRKCTLIT